MTPDDLAPGSTADSDDTGSEDTRMKGEAISQAWQQLRHYGMKNTLLYTVILPLSLACVGLTLAHLAHTPVVIALVAVGICLFAGMLDATTIHNFKKSRIQKMLSEGDCSFENLLAIVRNSREHKWDRVSVMVLVLGVLVYTVTIAFLLAGPT